MSQTRGEKRRTPKHTRQLSADVLESLRAMVDEDTRITAQHNMRARLVNLGLEMLAQIRPATRRTIALRLVHRGDNDYAHAANAELWPVAAVRGLDALPERSRDLLVVALNDPDLREQVAAWLEGVSGRPPQAPKDSPAAPPPPPSSGGRRSSTRTRKGTKPRKRN